MPDPAPLGVVVVRFGDPDPTEACLRSLAADPSTAPRDVAVVDNTPGGGSRLAAPVALAAEVSLPHNPGYGAGANAGVSALREGRCHAGYVILNHDVEVLPGFLDAAAAAVAGGAGAASGPVYLDRRDGPLWYAGGHLRILTGTVRQETSPAEADREKPVAFLPGTAFVSALRCWDEVGGFDESIFLYHEDVDLCRRVSAAGWELRFVPGMRAIHKMGTSTGSRGRSAFYLEHMTATRFRPYRSRIYRAYLAGLHTPYVVLRAVRVLAAEGEEGSGKARALLRGHRAALRSVLRRS